MENMIVITGLWIAATLTSLGVFIWALRGDRP
jgi:hypothetical protein